ncbi:MAG: hypothetical protein M1814_000515 [Vezdaea aestivalis]|nr:MAG: hypothetical protein M1814_000515 [Vezdaea aestivalis]
MVSPATKKRKKNDSTASPSNVRNLDFFFSKQAQKKEVESANCALGEGKAESKPDAKSSLQELDDESLARRLQAQFDEENHSSIPGLAEIPSSEPYHEPAQISPDPSEDPQDLAPPPTIAKGQHGNSKVLSLQSNAAVEDTLSSTIPFDESTLTFDPQKYLPDLSKLWSSEGGHATYAILTRCFVLVNSTASRLKIVDTLVNLLRLLIEGDPESLLPAVWLATNSISPSYVSLELGLGGSAISKALKNVCGLDNQGLKTLYNKYGDAGDVAYEAKKRQSFTLRKPKPLSIQGVYQSLVRIANSKGNRSQEIKQSIVERLVQDARGAEESRYIVRTLVQHLRIGAVKTTMLIALSRAFLLSRTPNAEYHAKSQVELRSLKKESLVDVWAKAEEIVKACFARRPNYNDLIPCLLECGPYDALPIRCGLGLHVPLRPMLGSITRDLGEMLTKLQGRDFSCEYKYDGQRAQVHCDDKGKVSIFSRHLELMTDKYPDLVALVPQIRGEGVSSFIMEGEVVAVDPTSGEMKTFQTLAGRARKDVVVGSVEVNVCLFAFDLMYLNGESLLDRSFRERRELLRSLFIEVPFKFTWVKNLDATSNDSEVVLEFFKASLDIKCEGIMVKILDNLANPNLELPLESEKIGGQGGEEDKSKGDPKEATREETKGSGKELAAPTTPKSKAKKGKTSDREPKTRRKALLATYEPDRRLDSWLKVKKDYDSTSFDTLDLIPVGAWHGSGRKAAWWSPILLAVRNPESGSLEAVCKCISGFTDKFYKENKEFYSEEGPHTIARPSYVEYAGHPDVWFEPQEVWEMAFADVTLSPTYTAAIGLVSDAKGLSLRFPRFLKKREDKSIDEASTNEFLANLWRKQEAKAPQIEDTNEEDLNIMEMED